MSKPLRRGQIPFVFSPIPNSIIDGWLCRMTPNEFAIYACVMRKTWGFQKQRDTIAVSQFVEMSGLPRRCVNRALNGLREKGLVHVSGSIRRPRMYEPLMPRYLESGGASSGPKESVGSASVGPTIGPLEAHSIERKKAQLSIVR